ncbi:hypothetical protein C5469_21245 [Photorhabdus cinerea]|uniref:Uncharacterized protein n=1 Tax=Photorhabdus cinerea TaxID=471575 RepID=A0A7X5QHL0_9GAMM|nr:hypothetical protein [Photorhabdus cinerea]
MTKISPYIKIKLHFNLIFIPKVKIDFNSKISKNLHNYEKTRRETHPDKINHQLQKIKKIIQKQTTLDSPMNR